MKSINRDEFENLVEGAEVLMTYRGRPKVFRTPYGEIVKLLRIKRLLSSNLLMRHAQRFACNAVKLANAGIACPEVLTIARVPHLKRQMVVYRELPGLSLREALTVAAEGDTASLVNAIGAYIAKLHEAGVYFRSIHFGNILVTSDEPRFALIDFLDLKILGHPLSLRRRIRNGKHIFRYPEDRQPLLDYWQDFCNGYGFNSKDFRHTDLLMKEWRQVAGRVAAIC